jgi:actin-related protein
MDDEEYEVGNEAQIVIDCGSFMTKAGFRGRDCPSCVFRSAVGHDKSWTKGSFVATGNTMRDRGLYVGTEAMIKRQILKLNYPIQNS